MLESEVDYEEDSREDDRCAHNKKSRALKLAPRRPRHLLGELSVRLFTIVNELSHLYF